MCTCTTYTHVHMPSLHSSAWAPTSERRMAASLQMVDFKAEYGASVRNSHQAEEHLMILGQCLNQLKPTKIMKLVKFLLKCRSKFFLWRGFFEQVFDEKRKRSCCLTPHRCSRTGNDSMLRTSIACFAHGSF